MNSFAATAIALAIAFSLLAISISNYHTEAERSQAVIGKACIEAGRHWGISWRGVQFCEKR